jgi:transposase
LVNGLRGLEDGIAKLNVEIAARAKSDPVAKRLMTIPGVGPVIATALVALAPAMETFSRGRDFSAWLGLTPLQHSSGGKERLGRTSKMGERSLRRLLIIGASSTIKAAVRKGAAPDSWLGQMLIRKPRMLVTLALALALALANKMARIIWAMMVRQEIYRAPAVAA